jgi:hypothetical protein
MPPVSYIPRNFPDSARVAFGWLEGVGFKEIAAASHDLYANVVWASESTYVYAMWDLHDAVVDVVLGPLVGGVPPDRLLARDEQGRRVSTPLWLLAWVRSGDESYARGLETFEGGTRGNIEQALAANSDALHRYGKELLAGRFEFLEVIDKADRQRMQANMDHRAWGSPPDWPSAE